MSDNKEAPQAQGQEQKGKQGKRKPWIRRGEQRLAPKKKDPTEIPILKYGPNNNFMRFKEAMSYTAMEKYGDLGRLIEQGTYYAGTPPVLTYLISIMIPTS